MYQTKNGFLLLDHKYKSGVMLDEYNGTYSIVSAREGQDGEVRSQWCKAKTGKDAYAAKDMPLGVRLGDKEVAIGVLKTFLAMLEEQAPTQQTFLGPDDEPPPF